MKISRLLTTLLVFSATLAMTTNVSAQTTATATASLTVNENLTITTTDLIFPDVMEGTTTSSATADGSNGGVFTLSGVANEDVNVEFTTLPANLSDVGGNGGVDIGVTWSGDASTDGGTTLLGVDPTTGQQTITLSGGGDAEVYLGGNASPDAAQTPSTYEASVELTASYVNI